MPASTEISVVIPCYNGSRFIEATIRSALAQTHPPLEVIVVDDGSTDDSAEIIRGIDDGRVRLLQQENQGESVARNRGMDEAKGDWIAFLDADDLWREDKLEKQIAAAQGDATTVAVVGNVHYFGNREEDAPPFDRPPHEMASVEYICELNAFIPSTLIVRADVPARFPVWTKYGEDYVFSLELAMAGGVAFVDEPLTRYRIHASGQSSHPATLVRQDQTVLRWLNENKEALGEERVAKIRERQLELFINRAYGAKSARLWERFDAMREYLTTLPPHPRIDAFLSERVYPRWLYWMKDMVAASEDVKQQRKTG